MAIQIKPVSDIAKKFASRGSAAGQDYASGVQNPRTGWQAATTNAASSYAQGVQAAIGNKSFERGVAKAGDSKWQRNAAGKGASRYGPGISAAQQDYASGVQPYIDTLSSLTLPPRGPKGDPSNNARVQAVNQALRAKKLTS